MKIMAFSNVINIILNPCSFMARHFPRLELAGQLGAGHRSGLAASSPYACSAPVACV